MKLIAKQQFTRAENAFDCTLWQKLMVACAIIIAFDPIRVFEEPLLQQVPVTLVIAYLTLAILRRPLAPLRSLTAVLLAIMFFYALPGIIYNKFTEDTGMFTAIIMFLLPISAAYAVDKETSINGELMLAQAQWIGLAYFFGSILRLAQDPNHELFWYGIHERSFLLGFIFLPSFLRRSYWTFAVTFAAAWLLLVLDFRATTAFALINGLALVALVRFKFPVVVVCIYIGAVAACLLSAYVGSDLVWALYTLVKGAYSTNINDEIRRATIVLAFDEWRKAPIFGDFFSGGGAYDIRPYVSWWQGGLLPLHNDYLDFVVRGGLVGICMFLIGFGSAVVTSIRNISRFRLAGNEDLGNWNAFLLAGLVNVAFVISFNPVLKTVSHAFNVQLILAWTVALQVAASFEADRSGLHAVRKVSTSQLPS